MAIPDGTQPFVFPSRKNGAFDPCRAPSLLGIQQLLSYAERSLSAEFHVLLLSLTGPSSFQQETTGSQSQSGRPIFLKPGTVDRTTKLALCDMR